VQYNPIHTVCNKQDIKSRIYLKTIQIESNNYKIDMIINNKIEGIKYPQVYMPIRRWSGAPDVLRIVFSVLPILTIPKIMILGIV
jgi:hypothetical protein